MNNNDPIDIMLQSEIAMIRDEIATVEQQMQDLEALHAEAVDGEGEAMQAVESARAVSDPLIWASREDPSQLAVYVGDTTWRFAHADAAEAHGKTVAAQEKLTVASARTARLRRVWTVLEWETLPHLQAALEHKQRELEQHRAAQSAAIDTATSTSHMEAFKRRLRGEK